jgi:hypothetical protein
MHGDSAISSPALDFLAAIAARERTGAFAMLDAADRDTLNRILRNYHDRGVTPGLERQARTFLISYRELNTYTRMLDAAEREQLDQILAAPVAEREVPWRWITIATAVIVGAGLAIGIGVVIASGAASNQSGPPPASSTVQQAAPPQMAPGSTDLQQLKQDYGPWRQLTPPDTGGPDLLLLQDGAYYASARWTVPPAATGWQTDLGGNVSSVQVSGNHASITDADGNPYTVGINQPFIVSGNPDTVLRVDPSGTVLSMSLAQATAVRQSLWK